MHLNLDHFSQKNGKYGENDSLLLYCLYKYLSWAEERSSKTGKMQKTIITPG